MGFVQSRGTFLCTRDERGDQCRPRVEADCPKWHGTLKEILELIALVEEKYPDVADIYISGGYDAAESPRHYFEYDEYEPWVTSWIEVVWTREPKES